MQALTKALQLHPTAAGLWSYAAAWEFQHNRNTNAARSLMQQGLRVCKTDQQLWLEYFCMELTYAQKLRTRQKILGIEPKGAPINTPIVKLLPMVAFNGRCTPA